ncbi:MAG: hypothetical protein HUK21_10695, partial [Fibrobacteraceae bacterium]|nr:hypothetical protein [Fibrobacteraceae bacterium]
MSKDKESFAGGNMGYHWAKYFVAGAVVFGVSFSFAATMQMENLNRGVSVANVGAGVLVSWRLLGS